MEKQSKGLRDQFGASWNPQLQMLDSHDKRGQSSFQTAWKFQGSSKENSNVLRKSNVFSYHKRGKWLHRNNRIYKSIVL